MHGAMTERESNSSIDVRQTHEPSHSNDEPELVRHHKTFEKFATRDLKELYRNYARPGSRQARSMMRELLSREPQNAAIWRHLSDAHFNRGRYKLAAICLRRMCVVRDRKPHDYRRYIMCKYRLGKKRACLDHAIRYTAYFGHSHIISQIVFAIATEQLGRSHRLFARAERAVQSCSKSDWEAHHHLLELVKEHLDQARPAGPDEAIRLLSYLKPCAEWPLIEAVVYRYYGKFFEARARLLSLIRERQLLHPAVIRLAVEVCHIHGEIGADEDVFRLAVGRLRPDDPHRARAELAIETLEYFARHTVRPDQVIVPQVCFASLPRYYNSPFHNLGKRIAFFGGSLAAGGAEKILALLFKAIVQTGRTEKCDLFIYDLYSSPNQHHFLDLIEGLGCRIYQMPRVPDPIRPLSYLPGSLGKWSQYIGHILRNGKYSTAYFALDHLIISGGLAALHYRVPNIILHTHNMAPTALCDDDADLNGWRNAYRSLLAHRQTTLVTCCNAAAGDYAKWADIPPRSIKVIPNGLEFPAPLDEAELCAARLAYDIPPSSLVIGSAFRFDHVKQPMVWIEVAKRILSRRPDAHFVIFGDGSLKPPFEKVLEECGLRSAFSLPGRITNAAPHFALFDAFLLTSKSEALPNAVVEAQAYGVPVFSFDVGGVAEAIVDGRSGYVTPPQQVDALAAMLVSSMADRGWLTKARVIASRNARNKFRIETMVDQFKPLLGLQGSAAHVLPRQAAATGRMIPLPSLRAKSKSPPFRPSCLKGATIVEERAASV